jgi:AcrR family transcriptional regulator
MKAAKARSGALLGVRERVEAVIALRREEGTLASLSVSELCRLAAVNRASLYAHHRDLIRQVTEWRGQGNGARRAKAPRSEVKQRHELSVARRQIRALLLTIAELQLEVAALQRRLLGEPRAPRKTAQRKASKSR